MLDGIRPSGASYPCLRPASSIPLGVLGYASRGGFPHPPHTHPPLDLLGCIFCNSVTLLYKAHALPHSAGLTHIPENAHLGAPAGIHSSGASRPCLCLACALLAVSHWEFWVCLYTPLEGLPALLYVQIAVSAGGAVHAGIHP